MKKRFFIPMALVMSMMMAVPAFAQHIYIGDTETVVSYDENGNKVITLIFDPAKRPDYMNPDSPNYWRKAEQAQMEQTTNVPALPLLCLWLLPSGSKTLFSRIFFSLSSFS